jgi:hypothetical protein
LVAAEGNPADGHLLDTQGELGQKEDTARVGLGRRRAVFREGGTGTG